MVGIERNTQIIEDSECAIFFYVEI